MGDIFISHVEDDAEVALEIALGLEEVGYSTWCYELDGIPGPSYLLQTGQAVASSKAVVVVISPHSVGSRQVTNEVVRAHESDKEFIPVRRGISHIEFQNRQPEWREAIGAATSIGVPKEGAVSILPRIIAGLKNLGIQPATKPDLARITQIREALGELPIITKIPKVEHSPATLSALEGKDRDAAGSMRCAFHPEREAVAACTNCGKLICSECNTVVDGKMYCKPCGNKMFMSSRTPQEKVTEKVTYNTALRWISGVFGVLFILSAIAGLPYFAESGLVSELIVDIINIILAITLLLMASVPQWVSTTLRIKLEERSVFIIVLVVSVIVGFIANGLGPVPPGGWWDYGT
jgi:hypothetical protein